VQKIPKISAINRYTKFVQTSVPPLQDSASTFGEGNIDAIGRPKKRWRNSCNSGDGTFMFMFMFMKKKKKKKMMMMMMMIIDSNVV
jgi:hypothetical protein